MVTVHSAHVTGGRDQFCKEEKCIAWYLFGMKNQNIYITGIQTFSLKGKVGGEKRKKKGKKTLKVSYFADQVRTKPVILVL